MSKGVKNAGDKVGDQIMANADLQVLKDLSVAAGQLYDGAVNSKGEPVDLGLKRDSLPSTNRKQFDAGKVRSAGDKILFYTKQNTQHNYKMASMTKAKWIADPKLVDGLKKNYRAHAVKSYTNSRRRRCQGRCRIRFTLPYRSCCSQLQNRWSL